MITRVVYLLCIGLLFSAPLQARQQLKLNWSSYRFSGDYGRELRTDTHMNQLSLNYRVRQWQLGVSQAYLQQRGPRLLLVDEYIDQQGYEVQEYVEQKQQRSGFADPNLRLSYLWPAAASYWRRSPMQWRLSGRWKVPLADDQDGFSNGRHEWYAALQHSQRYKRLMLSLTLGRHWRSAIAGGANNPRFYTNLGIMVFPLRGFGLGASLYQKQASSGQTAMARSLSVNGYWRINAGWSLTGSWGRGLSEVVSEQVLGLNLAHRWRL